MAVQIRPPAAADHDQWADLYREYAHDYPVGDEILDRVWSWILDVDHEVEALVAEDTAGHLVGLAHFRAFARPVLGTYGGYLDDLYVSPAARGTGLADAFLNRLGAIGVERGWSVIRWNTAEANYRARAKYDKFAKRSADRVQYDMELEVRQTPPK